MKDYVLVVLPFIILIPLWLGIWAWRQRRRTPPTEEELAAARVLGDPRWIPSGRAAVVFVVVHFAVYGVRDFTALPGTLKTALLVAPVVAFAWFGYAFVRELRGGDELERRIQGEAAALALFMFMIWLAGMWLMSEIWPVQRQRPFGGVIALLALNYVIGLFLAKSKYVPTGRSQP